MKTFDELWVELSTKVANGDPNSGTVKHVASGVHAIGKKVIEEAGEVWIAAEYEGKAKTAEEISQLLYQVQSLMLAVGITPNDVYETL